MSADITLLAAVSVLATVGAHHFLIWMRSPAAREHFWFGIASMGAAGAAAASYAALGVLVDETPVAQGMFIASALWLIATAWFAVEYARGDYRRRRIAFLATLLLASAAVVSLVSSGSTERDAFPGVAQDPDWLLTIAAVAFTFWLTSDGAIRLWSARQHFRAVTLGGGIGIFLMVFAVQGFGGRGFAVLAPPALYAFLIVACMLAYELAGAIADGRVASQRQRQELAHASRLSIVGELTASIAHEINQPLGAILSNADAGEILLENPDPPLDEIRQILADIRRDGLRASDVIRHVRTLVRKRKFVLEKLDANALATDVISLLEPEARRRRIPLGNAPSQQPAYVCGDRAHLEQVFINLMMNAMDAVETTGGADALQPAIVMGVSNTSHGEIELQITDGGPGLPAERLSHLFDSFFTTKPHGMGLGLSIARSIVEAHGGWIRAENNPGGGATFRVTLPPYDEPAG